MLMNDIPQMLVSEKRGWEDIDRSHFSHKWFFRSLVLPMSLLPPALYAYAELVHPGSIFALSVPALTPMQLLVMGVVFYGMQVAMVAYMAMFVRNVSLARDHDPGYDAAYSLAAIAPIPLWLSSLSLLVPSTGVVLAVGALAWAASIALLRHGVRPLLHVRDEQTAHYIANVVTICGVVAWVALIVIASLIGSVLLVWWKV